MWKVILPLFLTAALWAHAEASSDKSERETALGQLHQILTLLSTIEYPVEWQDKGRLLVLRNQAQKVIQCIDNKKMGLAHMGTLREYQNLIVDFRYSTAYFNAISTDSTREPIAELLRLVDTVTSERGFDDSPYTQITYGVFAQMKELILSLQQDVDANLRTKLSDLLPQIGQVMAIAKQGDRPKTFRAAEPVLMAIRGLYADFVRIGAIEKSYETVLNIQGLAELFAEFAQIDELDGKR